MIKRTGSKHARHLALLCAGALLLSPFVASASHSPTVPVSRSGTLSPQMVRQPILPLREAEGIEQGLPVPEASAPVEAYTAHPTEPESSDPPTPATPSPEAPATEAPPPEETPFQTEVPDVQTTPEPLPEAQPTEKPSSGETPTDVQSEDTPTPSAPVNLVPEALVQQVPAVLPGEAFDVYPYLSFTADSLEIPTNLGGDPPEALPYNTDENPARFDQSIAELVDYALVSFDEAGQSGVLLLDNAAVSGELVANGVNNGYAPIRGLQVAEGAEAGLYRLSLRIVWRMAAPDAAEQTAEVFLPFEVLASPVGSAERASVEAAGGIVVYNHAELINAITNTAHTLIYLGYSDENGGTIAYERLQGIPIRRSLVIDGTDPLTGHRMRLEDWKSSGPLDGLYAAVSGITVTVRNMDITGNNFYGVMYGTAHTSVGLVFENVDYNGRQIAHNANAGSFVSFTDCTVLIQNVSVGTAHEVVESPNVVISGNCSFSRVGPQDLSMIYLWGDTSYSLTIADGANVVMDTTNYMIFTTGSSATAMNVLGSLSLTTGGPNGAVTYADQYIGQLSVALGAKLAVRHNSSLWPSLLAGHLSVAGGLVIERSASAAPAVRLISQGSMRAESTAFVLLDNPGSGGTIRSLGTASLRFDVPVINRTSSSSVLAWNNRNGAPFSAQMSLTLGNAAVTGVSGLENGGAGASPTSGRLTGTQSLGADTRLALGTASLSLNPVYGAGQTVTGQAAGNATVAVYEYAYTDGAVGSLIQRRTGLSGGGFSATLDAPIQLSGSRIYASADNGVLLCYTYQDTLLPGPLFMNVPETLVFETIPLAAQHQIARRTDPGWAIDLYDARGDGHQILLYVKMEVPLTASGGDTLPGSLVFRAGDTWQVVNETDLLIYKEDTKSGIMDYQARWDAEEGFLVWLPAFKGVADDPYTATLTFTLVEGP